MDDLDLKHTLMAVKISLELNNQAFSKHFIHKSKLFRYPTDSTFAQWTHKTMPKIPSKNSYLIEITGLTDRELNLLFTSLNGIALRRIDLIVDFKGFLIDHLNLEVQSAFEDSGDYGTNLGNPQPNNAEVPYSYSDLLEKVKTLRPDVVTFLVGLAVGFMEGRSGSGWSGGAT